MHSAPSATWGSRASLGFMFAPRRVADGLDPGLCPRSARRSPDRLNKNRFFCPVARAVTLITRSRVRYRIIAVAILNIGLDWACRGR